MGRSSRSAISGTAKAVGPFDFTQAISRLCIDICDRHEAFQHIDVSRIAICFTQARSRVLHGLQAKLTPMRFEKGMLTCVRRGRQWTVQRLFVGQREMLYILTFYLPRFLDQSFSEKFITILHELYHISPRFDGDIRRFDGRYHVHSSSQQDYDGQMDIYAREYLASGPPPELYEFLKVDFRQILRQHGGVVGLQVPIPKLIPIEQSRTA
ncbi:putative metallopeptidase [Planctomicrobium sp. SH664]|uniref:putative metallopeptidase n=1 Tax=Planctomicrobium sp. SH664 TaxID=3448125 RepID=UPI003F5C0A92